MDVNESDRSAPFAVGWIEAWTRMGRAWLREHLAPDFVHVSPTIRDAPSPEEQAILDLAD